MAYDAQGKIYIPLEDFYAFVLKYLPRQEGEISYDLDGMQVQNGDLEIEYAVGSEVDPKDWASPPAWLTKKQNMG